MNGRTKPVICIFIAAACGAASAQTWTWPGCPDVTNTNFTYTNIVVRGSQPDVNLAEPVKMDFDMDASGRVDVYYVERATGNVKRFNAAANSMTQLGTLNTFKGPMINGGNIEEGLTGIALDPDFKTNRYVYLHYSPAASVVFRISRFTLSGTTLGSEKILLDIPAQRNVCCHTGGGMTFDAYGDLWISMGNNTDIGGGTSQSINETNNYSSDEWGASSTAGLRGGILRIHPDNSTKGYTIPAGNFGEYFAAQTGNAQYNDTAKVKPEIYLKGTRNAYSLQVDPVRRWVMWGDVGPDRGLAQEEYNLRKTPAFMGWPYFAGNNISFVGGKTASAPTNTSKWNLGLTTLPPATAAINSYGQSAAMTGPLYRYDGDLTSTVKLPPHFTRKWFVADYNRDEVRLLTLDSAGTTITQNQLIFTNHTFSGIVDFKTGPDGALYVLNYGHTFFGSTTSTAITKVAYTGTCRPADPKLEKPAGTYLNPGAQYVTNKSGWVVLLNSGKPVRVPEGMTGFELYDMAGRKVWQIQRLRAGQSFTLPSGLPAGALKYRWVSAN